MENKIFPKYAPNPLVASLPDFVKNPANFQKIQRALLDTFGGHSHSEIAQFAACKKCSEGMMERRMLLKKLGFKNAAQYMEWRKIHENIITRVPLRKYDE